MTTSLIYDILLSELLLINYKIIMTIKEKKIIYHKDHILAKILCCIINTLLILFYISTNSIILLVVANIFYFFGVNSIAYTIETVKQHSHKHDKI